MQGGINVTQQLTLIGLAPPQMTQPLCTTFHIHSWEVTEALYAGFHPLSVEESITGFSLVQATQYCVQLQDIPLQHSTGVTTDSKLSNSMGQTAFVEEMNKQRKTLVYRGG